MNIEIKAKKFEVYYEDFVFKLTHKEAINYCKFLGYGWRLPAKSELKEMNKYQERLGLKPTGYWSSTEEFSNYAWYYNFDGPSSTYHKSNTCRVRAVRTI